MSLAGRVALQRCEGALVRLVDELVGRFDAGDGRAGPGLCQAVLALAEIQRASAPGSTGSLLTSQQMAERMGVSVSTLLRYKRAKKIQPTVARGKLLRWSGRETL